MELDVGPELELRTETQAGRTTVFASGDLDMWSAPRLENALLDVERTSPAEIVLDLGGLETVDSMGLRTVLAACSRAELGGWRVLVARPSAPVRRIFRITGLDSRLPVADDPLDSS